MAVAVPSPRTLARVNASIDSRAKALTTALARILEQYARANLSEALRDPYAYAGLRVRKQKEDDVWLEAQLRRLLLIYGLREAADSASVAAGRIIIPESAVARATSEKPVDIKWFGEIQNGVVVRAQQISEQTKQAARDSVKAIILDAQKETTQPSAGEIARRIRTSFTGPGEAERAHRVHATEDGREFVFSSERAAVIARTELAQAQNSGAFNGYVESGVTEIEWMAYGDGRSGKRHHERMNGKKVKVGEYFTLPSGAKLRYPADPLGPIGETVNCRCSVAPVVDTGSRRARSAPMMPASPPATPPEESDADKAVAWLTRLAGETKPIAQPAKPPVAAKPAKPTKPTLDQDKLNRVQADLERLKAERARQLAAEAERKALAERRRLEAERARAKPVAPVKEQARAAAAAAPTDGTRTPGSTKWMPPEYDTARRKVFGEVVPTGKFDQTKMEKALQNLSKRENQVEARKQVGELIAAYRLTDRDLTTGDTLNASTMTVTPKLTGKATAYHHWDGRIELEPNVYEAAKKFANGDRSKSAQRAMSVLIHEQAHGYSPMTSDAYSGVGELVEEATTEMVARKIFRESFDGVIQVNAKDAHGFAPYQPWIDGLLEGAKKLNIDAPVETLERAAFIFKRGTDKSITAPWEARRRFAEAILEASGKKGISELRKIEAMLDDLAKEKGI